MNQGLYYHLAKIEDCHWWFAYRRKLAEDFLSQINMDGDIRGLDIGCGTGGNLELLEKYCHDVIGMDFSETAISLAEKKYLKAKFIQGDANHLSHLFEPESFGLITIFNVLYHEWIINELDVLRQCNNILSPGGIIVVTEPAFNILKRRHDIQAMGKRRYRLGQFEGLLKAAGLKVIAGTYFNALSFLPAFFLSLMDRLYDIKKKGIIKENFVKELQMPGNKIDRILLRLMDAERKIISSTSKLPFGVTLMCIAQKPSNI